ncbi:nanos homolog 1-like [Portunus trituberculatus]|uniref:nanos homolog 1-like n=1 Tax=Portunus trituberculatus TaxID=210409 RepID=UPI001E1D0BE8|nr:nanos homolog 1-like [Portunus trituberculatus]
MRTAAHPAHIFHAPSHWPVFPGFRVPPASPATPESIESILAEFRSIGPDTPCPLPRELPVMAPLSPPAAHHTYRGQRSHRRAPRCKFCLQNGEEDIFHLFKDEAGGVVCPVLSAYTCKLCGAAGTQAHTLKYCPLNRLTQGDPVAAGMAPGLMPSFITLDHLRM